MADRATKSGIALEAQQKVSQFYLNGWKEVQLINAPLFQIHSKYDEHLAAQLLQWVEQVTGQNIDKSGNVESFNALFKDGKILCQLANALEPGAIKKFNESKMAFKQMENIR